MGAMRTAREMIALTDRLLKRTERLFIPRAPTPAQMLRYSRVEVVQLAELRRTPQAMQWSRFLEGDHPGPLVPGYGDHPLVVRMRDGENLIFDGHHRIVDAMSDGLTQTTAFVIDAAAYDPAAAGRPPRERADEMTDEELLDALFDDDEDSERLARMRRWAERSAFVDEGGLPFVWFHATDAEDFNVFAECGEGSVGFHFGCSRVASNRASDIAHDADAEGCRIIPVVCRAERPLRLPDLLTWEGPRVLGALLDANALDEQCFDELMDEGLLELSTVYALLEIAGYDSVVYANETERRGVGEPGSDSIVVWRPELLKSPFSEKFDLLDPRLLSQDPLSIVERARWNDDAHAIRGEVERLGMMRRRHREDGLASSYPRLR